MKALVCEVCGSNEILKDGDYFVCQSCGTKYTTESVKKLLVEGTVTVDSSNRYSNALVLARRAREEGNAEDAEKYYNEVLILDPNNWEASFYHTLYKSYQTNIARISSAAISVKNSFFSTVSVINKIEDETERLVALTDMEGSIIKFASSLFSSAGTFYIRHKDATGSYSEFADRADTILNMLLDIGDYFNRVYSDSNNEVVNAGYKKAAAAAYKAAIDLDKSGEGIPMYISRISDDRKRSITGTINKEFPGANYEVKEHHPGLALLFFIFLPGVSIGLGMLLNSPLLGLILFIGGLYLFTKM